MQLGLKIDVCTYAGMRHGVPALMRLFDELKVRASFFVAVGPDHSGRAIRRILRPGFFEKMRRTGAASTYGWQTLLYGTLLPGPHVGRRCSTTLRELVRAGHEVALHGYDHMYWMDVLPRRDLATARIELTRGMTAFGEAVGQAPRAFGAPGWQCSAATLQAEDDLQLDYHSDTRGRTPFRPRIGNTAFHTLELPTTMLTLDESLGRHGTTASELTAYYLRQLRPGYNVYTAHAEMEGRQQMPIYRALLQAASGEVEFQRLADLAASHAASPSCEIQAAPIEGRSGTVAWQVEDAPVGTGTAG